MTYALLKEVKERAGFDAALVEDICFGNVSTRPPFPLPLPSHAPEREASY